MYTAASATPHHRLISSFPTVFSTWVAMVDKFGSHHQTTHDYTTLRTEQLHLIALTVLQ